MKVSIEKYYTKQYREKCNKATATQKVARVRVECFVEMEAPVTGQEKFKNQEISLLTLAKLPRVLKFRTRVN